MADTGEEGGSTGREKEGSWGVQLFVSFRDFVVYSFFLSSIYFRTGLEMYPTTPHLRRAICSETEQRVIMPMKDDPGMNKKKEEPESS